MIIGITSPLTPESTKVPKAHSPATAARATPLAADATDAKAPDAIEMVEAIFTFVPPETATSAISPEAGAFIKTPIGFSASPQRTTWLLVVSHLTILYWEDERSAPALKAWMTGF